MLFILHNIYSPNKPRFNLLSTSLFLKLNNLDSVYLWIFLLLEMTLLYYVFIPEATKKHNKFKMIVYKSIKAAVVRLNQIQHSKNIKSIFIQVIWHWLEWSTGGKNIGITSIYFMSNKLSNIQSFCLILRYSFCALHTYMLHTYIFN